MVVRLLLILLAVLAGSLAGQQFREHTIATELKGGYQVVIADINADGRPDLIVLASGMPDLLWFENTPDKTWPRHVIASGFSRMINVAPCDVNGDGIPELMLAHEFANDASKSIGILTLLRHQGSVTNPWSTQEIDRLTTSHRLRWADIRGDGHKVLVNAPLTGAAATPPNYDDATPLVFYDPKDWKRQQISDANRGVVHGILIYDWDRKGRDAVLTAGFTGIYVHALTKAGVWERKEIAKGDLTPYPKGGSSDIAIGMLGKVRYLAAIEPWHGNEVAVYAPDRKVIDTALTDGHTILAADFDHDGHDEIVAGCRGGPKGVYIYKHERSGWQRHAVDEGGIAAASCAAADLNADGRVDLVCIGSGTANLKWYENVKAGRSAR